jgi:predicted phage-related endonuclease
MTANQTQQLVKNPNTKKAMAVLAKYAQLESQLKSVEKEAKEATELIKNAMIEASVPKIEIDLPGLTGYITLAERTNYRAEDIEQVPEEFTKPALDTDKVKAHHTLKGELPAGVAESKTQYITKKFKVVE